MTEINLSVIRTDGGTQPRTRLNQEVINEYAEAMAAGVIFPPVTIFYDGTNYWLADGFHRLEAARNINAASIAAEIRQGTQRDAILHSVGVNATHGLRRSNSDKRRAVETLLRDPEWSQWSDSAIAKACKVDNKTVTRIRVDLGIPKSEARKGTDGRIINTTKIGRKSDGASSIEELDVALDNSESLPASIRAKPEKANVTDQSPDSCSTIRVLRIEPENPEQIELVVDTFQIISSSFYAEIECCTRILITLLKQIQAQPVFTEPEFDLRKIAESKTVIRGCLKSSEGSTFMPTASP